MRGSPEMSTPLHFSPTTFSFPQQIQVDTREIQVSPTDNKRGNTQYTILNFLHKRKIPVCEKPLHLISTPESSSKHYTICTQLGFQIKPNLCKPKRKLQNLLSIITSLNVKSEFWIQLFLSRSPCIPLSWFHIHVYIHTYTCNCSSEQKPVITELIPRTRSIYTTS